MTTNGCSKKLCPMQVGAADNCALTKEQCPYFTQDVDVQELLNLIKAEVASEMCKMLREDLKGFVDKDYLERLLTVYEKKYTEGESDGN